MSHVSEKMNMRKAYRNKKYLSSKTTFLKYKKKLSGVDIFFKKKE
jgi:hypothetical protein